MSSNTPFGKDEQDPFSDDFEQDPFVDDHFSQREYQSGPAHQTYQAGGLKKLPDSDTILVLGIISIVGSFCYGIIGLIISIIAIAMAGKPMRVYKADPGAYTVSSYSNLKTGRICAIIGLSISIVYLLAIVAFVIFIAAVDGNF